MVIYKNINLVYGILDYNSYYAYIIMMFLYVLRLASDFWKYFAYWLLEFLSS